MLAFRLIFGALLLAALACFGLSLITRDLKWRRRGVAILTWSLVVALGSFALLYLGSLATTSSR